MSLNRKTSHFISPVALIALFLTASAARAQSIASGAASLLIQQASKKEQKGETNPEVEQLKQRVEQLQSLVEQQQRTLAEVLKKLGELDSHTQAAVPVTSYKSDRQSDGNPDATVAVSPDLHTASLEVSALEVSSHAKSAPQGQPAAQDKPKAGTTFPALSLRGTCHNSRTW